LQNDHEIELNEQSESVECKERWGDNLKYIRDNYKWDFEYNFMNTHHEDVKRRRLYLRSGEGSEVAAE